MNKDILSDYTVKLSKEDIKDLAGYQKAHLVSQLVIAERLEMIAKILMRILEKMK